MFWHYISFVCTANNTLLYSFGQSVVFIHVVAFATCYEGISPGNLVYTSIITDIPSLYSIMYILELVKCKTRCSLQYEGYYIRHRPFDNQGGGRFLGLENCIFFSAFRDIFSFFRAPRALIIYFRASRDRNIFSI